MRSLTSSLLHYGHRRWMNGQPLRYMGNAPLVVGAKYTLSRAFLAEDVEIFTRLTGDRNPIHSCQGVEQTVLPGVLCASMFPAIIGSQFPGALYLKQSLNFRKVAQLGDTLQADVMVERSTGRRVVFLTECRNSSGELVVDGRALALIPDGKS